MQHLLFLLFLGSFFSGDTPYQISFESIQGNTIHLSELKGQRILVIAFDGELPDTRHFLSIDSLAKSDQVKTRLILVPATDLGELQQQLAKDALISRLASINKKGVIISQPMPVKKNAGEKQHPLFKWLTHVEENSHFDRDVEQSGQLFMISEQGVLYGVHDKQLPAATLKEVMTQKIKQ